MIALALDAEVAEYIERFADDVDDAGKRLVVRNGRAKERRVIGGSGTVAIRAPRVNDKRVDEECGERMRFRRGNLPGDAHRSPKVTEVLPVLYLEGLLVTVEVEPAQQRRYGPALVGGEFLIGQPAAALEPEQIGGRAARHEVAMQDRLDVVLEPCALTHQMRPARDPAPARLRVLVRDPHFRQIVGRQQRPERSARRPCRSSRATPRSHASCAG